MRLRKYAKNGNGPTNPAENLHKWKRNPKPVDREGNPVRIGRSRKTRNPPSSLWEGFRCGWAAGCFPTLSRSIIAAAGLNFSVRNGKRCAPAHCRHSSLGRPSRDGVKADTTAAAHKRAEALGPLVPLGSTCRHARTCGLSTSSSPTALKGGLISGRASRLDALSAYPLRTRLPGSAPGGATGSP